MTLKVYDIFGNEVASLVNESHDAGTYNIVIEASRLASGIYIFTLRAGIYTESRKMILTKLG